ncbi:protein Lines homolog 1-like [Branchiostoma floridae x Branchiostoma japonicum]
MMAVYKKLKGEDIVGKLDSLHSDILANRLDHLDAQDVSQSLNLHESCDCEQPIIGSENKLFMTQERDTCLVKLSITTILFDKLGSGGKDENRDNEKLQEICRRLLLQDYKLLECLDLLFGSGDQLIRYTACKTAASVLVNSPTEMQPFPKTWLPGLLQQVKESPHSGRAVCTFDLFKLVIRAHGNSVPSMPEESGSAVVPKGTGIACFEILDENWDQLTQLYLRDSQSLAEQQRSTSNQEREVAFLSLLSLWIECLNSEVGAVSQLHNSNVLLELVPALKCTKSSLVYANILEVFSQSLACEQEEVSAYSETVTSVAHALLQTFDDETMQRVPWKDTYVGFGGTDFVEGQLVTGQKRGDWVLVRTLVLVLLKACSIVSGLSGPEQVQAIITNLQRLSSFVCEKLAIASDGQVSPGAGEVQDTCSQTGSWLFQVFSDQDDSMIEAMLCLLDINTAVSRYATDSLPVVRSFNPHSIFLQFLETTTWDHSILLDLLISLETSFLTYITRYLHLVITEWQAFLKTNQVFSGTKVDTCGSSDCGTESRGEGFGIPNCDKPGFNQTGEKRCKSPHLPQPKHTHGNLSQNSVPQQSDQTSATEKELDNIELDEVPALKVVTMPLPDIDGFEMDIAGQTQPADTNVETPHYKHSQENCDGDKGDTSSESSDDDADSTDNVEEESTLDRTMGVLIRLRLAVERLNDKKLFPYNVSPLVKLLEMVEAKYEEE